MSLVTAFELFAGAGLAAVDVGSLEADGSDERPLLLAGSDGPTVTVNDSLEGRIISEETVSQMKCRLDRFCALSSRAFTDRAMSL